MLLALALAMGCKAQHPEVGPQPLMQSFQQLVHDTNVSDVSNAYACEFDSSLWTRYPQWKQYMESYWERRHLWCMALRDSTMMVTTQIITASPQYDS